MHANYLAEGTDAQYRASAHLFSRFGRTALLTERDNTRCSRPRTTPGEQTRVRVAAHQRLDGDPLFRPWLEPRLLAGWIDEGNLWGAHVSTKRMDDPSPS